MSWLLALLGPFLLEGAGQQKVAQGTPSAPTSLRRKERALLAYLVTTGRPHHRQTLAGLFCRDAAVPMRALRLLLSRIRHHLGADAILIWQDTVQFNNRAGQVDYLQFGLILESNLAAVSLEQLETAVALYRGEFLADTALDDAPEFELWLLGERARLHNLYERGLMELVTRLISQEEYQAAIRFSQRLLQSNPLLEEAHVKLIWLYARTGQREAALAQYESCRDLLWRELAVEPTPELKALYADVLAGRPAIAFKTASRNGTAVALSKAPDFVGRDAELERLQNIWSAAWDGQGGVVLVEAEAGGGKTRLVQEFGRNLPKESFLVGRCYESTITLPYHPWIEVLEAHLANLDDTSLKRLSPFAQNYLTRLLPGLAQRLWQKASPPLPTSSSELERLFAAVGEFLFQLPAKNRVLLIFIDDLQWADETSLRLFHFIARRATQSKLLLIGAFRSEEIDEGLLPILLGDLQRLSPHRIPLAPLSPKAIGRLTAEQWPKLPEDERPQVVARLAQATGGNALFVSEVLRELAGTTQIPAELPVPATVRELIGYRLAHMSHGGRQVIEALSIFHSSATSAEAQEVSARSEEETALAIDWALRRGLLHAEPESKPARYTFHHDLVRDAIVGQLSHPRRELLHRRVARRLEQGGGQAALGNAALLVYHWGMAGDVEKEGQYAALAGEQAAAVYAHDEAVHYFERALELLPQTARYVEVECHLADVWVIIGKWPEAEAMYRQAFATAEKLGDRRLQAHSQAFLGRLLSRQGRYREALAELEQARTIYEAIGDRKGTAESIGTIGIIFLQMDKFDQALTCYEQALQIEQELDNQTGMAIWMANIANVFHERRDYGKALVGYQESIRIQEELGHKLWLGVSLGNLGNLYRDTGEYRQALECYAQALQHRHSLADKAGVAIVAENMGKLYMNAGAYSSALACFRRALQIDLELNHKENIASVLGQVGELHRVIAEADGTETAQERTLGYVERSILLLRLVEAKYYLCQHLVIKATILFHCGRYEEAHILCQEGQTLATGVREDVYSSARLLSLRLEVALEQLSVLEAIERLQSLLQESTEDNEQAAVQYEIWRLDKRQAEAGQSAAELYQNLYSKTPDILYRRRYEELTGQTLPAPLPLPELPEIITSPPVDLEALMRQVDHFIAQL